MTDTFKGKVPDARASTANWVVVLRGGVDAFFGPAALVVMGRPWSRWTVLSDYAGRPAEAAALVERAFDAVPVRGIGVLAAPDGPQSSRRETTRSPAWPSSKRQKVSLNSA